jgi:hypothetical protein
MRNDLSAIRGCLDQFTQRVLVARRREGLGFHRVLVALHSRAWILSLLQWFS